MSLPVVALHHFTLYGVFQSARAISDLETTVAELSRLLDATRVEDDRVAKLQAQHSQDLAELTALHDRLENAQAEKEAAEVAWQAQTDAAKRAAADLRRDLDEVRAGPSGGGGGHSGAVTFHTPSLLGRWRCWCGNRCLSPINPRPRRRPSKCNCR